MAKLPLAQRPDGWLGRVFGWLMEWGNRTAYREVLAALDLQSGEDLLEIGFGTGRFLKLAAAQTETGLIAGVDPAATMVKKVEKQFPDVREGTDKDLGRDLNWPADSFDAIAAIHSFQFWEAPADSLQRIKGLLKPGGRLCLCLRLHGSRPPDWLPNPLSKVGNAEKEVEAAKSLLTEQGFDPVYVTWSTRSSAVVIAHASEVD